MEVLKPLIEQLVEIIKSGKDVVSGNLPEVMKQIIAYGTWSDWFWIKVAIVLLLVGILLIVADHFEADPYSMHGFFVFGGIFIFAGILVAAINYTDLKKMQLAPKVYMIDVLHDYLKSESK